MFLDAFTILILWEHILEHYIVQAMRVELSTYKQTNKYICVDGISQIPSKMSYKIEVIYKHLIYARLLL